ncbi:hypothetical protein [Novosphingobium colocasiae]|uniref:hypothetical protein n=1 Tax=Novosphingobium colocasiae TaxID=1256513 RepID=UPI0035B3FD27
MNLIYDDVTLDQFRATCTDPDLLALVERLVAREKARNLWHLTAIVIGGPYLDLLGIDEEPDWAWRHEHGAWIELGLTAGNEGFAWLVLRHR